MKPTRIERAAATLAAEWNSIPDAARALAEAAVSDGVESFRVLKALPDSFANAVKDVVTEAIGVWMRGAFSSRARKVEKLLLVVPHLPTTWRPVATELLTAMLAGEREPAE